MWHLSIIAPARHHTFILVAFHDQNTRKSLMIAELQILFTDFTRIKAVTGKRHTSLQMAIVLVIASFVAQYILTAIQNPHI